MEKSDDGEVGTERSRGRSGDGKTMVKVVRKEHGEAGKERSMKKAGTETDQGEGGDGKDHSDTGGGDGKAQGGDGKDMWESGKDHSGDWKRHGWEKGGEGKDHWWRMEKTMWRVVQEKIMEKAEWKKITVEMRRTRPEKTMEVK
ncbi:hypothetical protein Tco_0111520 [Tanacetum coccineum]